MDYSKNNPDRDILEAKEAAWRFDPERTLREIYLDLAVIFLRISHTLAKIV
jgi:hypothetical protein